MPTYNLANMEDRVDDAIQVALDFGQIDGDHHKMWVIDQMLRKLLGEEQYEHTIRDYEEADEDGNSEYEWDTGIAP